MLRCVCSIRSSRLSSSEKKKHFAWPGILISPRNIVERFVCGEMVEDCVVVVRWLPYCQVISNLISVLLVLGALRIRISDPIRIAIVSDTRRAPNRIV